MYLVYIYRFGLYVFSCIFQYRSIGDEDESRYFIFWYIELEINKIHIHSHFSFMNNKFNNILYVFGDVT